MLDYKIDIRNEKQLKKISFYLLNIWILYPLFMMLLTYYINNTLARNIMYYLLNFIGLSGITIGTIYFYKRKDKFNFKKHLIYILGLLLIIWLFITSLLGIDIFLSLFGEDYRKEGFQTYIYYIGVFILGLVLKDDNNKIKLFNTLLFTEMIICVISLIDDPLTYKLMHNQEPYTGIFSQFNHYGYYLMFGVLISVILYLNSKKNIHKVIYILTYTILLYTLILNDTFGCFLAILFTFLLLIYFFRTKIKLLIPTIIIFILLCIFTYSDGINIVYRNFSGLFHDTEIINDTVNKGKKKNKYELQRLGTNRGLLWEYGIKYIKKRPINGYGLETIQILYRKYWINQSRPHNILIQMGVASGIPGIILYLSFIILIFYRGLKNIKNYNDINIGIYLICICYFISSMFGNSMFYTTPYFIMFLGMLVSNTV